MPTYKFDQVKLPFIHNIIVENLQDIISHNIHSSKIDINDCCVYNKHNNYDLESGIYTKAFLEEFLGKKVFDYLLACTSTVDMLNNKDKQYFIEIKIMLDPEKENVEEEKKIMLDPEKENVEEEKKVRGRPPKSSKS